MKINANILILDSEEANNPKWVDTVLKQAGIRRERGLAQVGGQMAIQCCHIGEEQLQALQKQVPDLTIVR